MSQQNLQPFLIVFKADIIRHSEPSYVMTFNKSCIVYSMNALSANEDFHCGRIRNLDSPASGKVITNYYKGSYYGTPWDSVAVIDIKPL